MVLAREQRHQVDHVNDTDLDLGCVLAQPASRRHRLERRDVAGAGQTTSGSAPWSLLAQCHTRRAAGAVFDGRVHVEPLELRLLVDDNQVHVVTAAQAMVRDRQQAVCVWRQVDAGHAPPFGQDHIDKPGALWLNPLWSLRQQVDVSRILSEAIDRATAVHVPPPAILCAAPSSTRRSSRTPLGHEHAVSPG